MARGLDDRPPEPRTARQPHGWSEVFCCGMILLVLVAALVLLGLLSR